MKLCSEIWNEQAFYITLLKEQHFAMINKVEKKLSSTRIRA